MLYIQRLLPDRMEPKITCGKQQFALIISQQEIYREIITYLPQTEAKDIGGDLAHLGME